jgi:hypothetical protein
MVIAAITLITSYYVHLVPDPCLSLPCHANASCSREGMLSEGFLCTCDPDFTGDGYNCTEIEGID